MLLAVVTRAAPTAEIVHDLLELFPQATVADCSACELRQPASADGARQNALFEHPSPGKPARVAYVLPLPSLNASELLLFSFETALADGITLSAADGVRFAVELDGQEVFAELSRETRWTPQTIDLTAHGGKTVRLVLLTHEVGNTSFDWAVWGSPRIIKISKTAPKLEANRGIVLARIAGGQTVTIGNSVLSNKLDRPAWLAKQFNQDTTWESHDAATMAAPFAAKLQLLKLGPARGLIRAGETAIVRAEVRNAGAGSLAPKEAAIELLGVSSHAVPALVPGASWLAEWTLTNVQPMELHAKVGTNELRSRLEVSSPLGATSIANDQLKLDFVREPDGFAAVRIFARHGKGWKEVAVWTPLFKLVTDTKAGIQEWTVRPLATSSQSRSAIEFLQPALDADGVEWQVRLRVRLDRDRPMARIQYEWQSRKPRAASALWGPNIYINGSKSWGLFPGLEYLYGPERSSNPRDFNPPLEDRRTPHPHKITIPVMAITTSSNPFQSPGSRFFTPDSLIDHAGPIDAGPQHTVALFWNPTNASPRFASPNFDQHMDNHRLALFLPTVPDLLNENADRAHTPLTNLPARLDATLVVAPGSALAAVREWLRDQGGLPGPNPWPRTFQEELDICRIGFLKTVSDDQGEKFRHCIGWGASHSPGFAALLWLDSRISGNRDARARVDRVAASILREGGAGGFMSQANCHIMQWEFPFLYGHLPEAMTHLDGFIAALIKAQRPDGGWVYEPASKEQADLGRAGDSVLGTCANRASTLLRFARITGDGSALKAGEKALRFMEMFRVPRGGQTWECPMYEPDILAAAYAIRAYHDAYHITGNRRWLTNAVYWGETGVPFVYLWSLPDKPMMLGATIPVFGSTFYTHSWLGMPVQWCGLVYAYHVFHLAQELQKTPLVLALNFSAEDWRRIVELITVSATHQQFADGDKVGAYPDSISGFEKRNPAFINPEDILVNVLALYGHDPDIKTAKLRNGRISSIARVENIKGNRFDLFWFLGETSHALIHGAKPKKVLVNGRELAATHWDEKRQRLYLSVVHAEAKVNVELVH